MEFTLNENTKRLYVGNMLSTLPMLRARMGLTQSELAGRLGYTRQTLTAMESGRRAMPWTTYLALCFIFDGCEQTRPLLELYDICPELVRGYLRFDGRSGSNERSG